MTKLAIVADPRHPTDAMLARAHLIQSAWCYDYVGYKDFYRRVRDNYADHLTILDWQHIGAGQPEHTANNTLDRFFAVAIELQPHEIIIPDVFGDHYATLVSAQNWIDYWCMHTPAPFDAEYRPTFMFIPQGANFADWLSCLSDGLGMFGEWVDTIGIAKAVEQWTPRINVLPHVNGLNRKIHMLGVWKGVSEMFGHEDVRSWDTSLPIAFAQHGKYITEYPNEKIQLVPGADVSLVHVVDNISYMQEVLDDTRA